MGANIPVSPFLWIPVFLACACANASAQPADMKGRGMEENGPAMNGTRIGADPKLERGLRVVQLREGVTLANGTKLSDVVARGSALVSPSKAGASFVGARMDGLTTYDEPVRLRIDAIDKAPDPKPSTPINENEDVLLYSVTYQGGSWSRDPAGKKTWIWHTTWAPLCPGTEKAIALPGRWNYHRDQVGDSAKLSSEPSELTLSCQKSAIGKCIERLGYKPWRQASFDEMHQICVRAVRADYCGDGRSSTKEGQRVNFYDSLGIQRDEAEWDLEAEWTKQGPRCLNYSRLLGAGRVASVNLKGFEQDCMRRPLPPPCPTSRSAGAEGAVLRTEIGPPGP